MNYKLNIKKRVFALSNFSHSYYIATKYIDKIEIIDSIKTVKWVDIVFRRIRFIEIPSKTEIHSKEEALKRKLIRILNLGISREIKRLNILECISKDYGNKVLFTPAPSIAKIYSVHLGNTFSVVNLFDELKSGFLKKIEYLLRYSIPLKGMDEGKGLTVFTNPCSDLFIRAYKKIHPNRRIIIRYHDRLNGGLGKEAPSRLNILKMLSLLRSEGVVDELESYYQSDAEDMNGYYRPNGVDPQVLDVYKIEFCDVLYRFIGGSKFEGNRSRLNELKEFRVTLRNFYPNIDQWIEEKSVLSVKDWIPYEEYLKKAASSELCVDLTRLGQEEGFSYRIPEALFLNKKIITNRKILTKEPFYSPDRVFIIGIDDLKRLPDFLEKDIEPLPEKILQFYNARLWWSDSDPIKKREC